MADYVWMSLCVAESDAYKLEGWADTEPEPDDVEEGIVRVFNSEVAWGNTDEIRELQIPFYGTHDSRYEIDQRVFAYDGETFVYVKTTDQESPAVSVDADGHLHGIEDAMEYWRVRKQAEAKMREKQNTGGVKDHEQLQLPDQNTDQHCGQDVHR